MKIGVDLDGVVFDTESRFHAYAELFDLENDGNGIVDPSQQLIRQRYNWKDDKIKAFFEKVVENIELNAPLMPLAKEMLERLKEDGHEIIFITNRTRASDKEVEYTNQRLKEENIIYDKLIFTIKSKLSHCQNEKIDIMIDDRVKVVEELAQNNITCIYFQDFSRQDIEGENIYHADNWPQVYRVIKKITTE